MSDSSRGCLGRWHFRLPALSSSRLWRFGKAMRPMYRRRSRLWFIEPGVIGLRAVGNIMPPWKARQVARGSRNPRHKDEYENQFKELPGAARRKGPTSGVADKGEALLRVEGGLCKTPASTRCAVE